MMPGLQELIHKLEEGEGAKYIRIAFFVLALLGLTAVWHIREAKSFSSIEAMDAGQIARNIADGNGYSTDCVRPFSVSLIEQHRGGRGSLLKEPHPDLANAPLYPVVLAALMKVLPFDWKVSAATFWRYQPEVLIGWFNQVLFFVAMFQVFWLASRLFDRAVGFLSAILLGLTEVFWDFTTSGLSTMLLIVMFLGLVHLLVLLDECVREEIKPKVRILSLVAAAGLLVGLMALTRYSMGWLILPVAGFIALYAVSLRAPAALLSVALFGITLAPWLVRNYQVSGHAFGLAGYAIHEGSNVFPGHILARSMPKNMTLELNKIDTEHYLKKLFVNGRDILERDLPESAGNWILAFFLGAIFVPYRNPTLGRLKLLMMAALGIFVVVQAMGRTGYSDHAPRFNSENLLVILTPICFIFGAAFFFTLLDQIQFPLPWLRSAIITLFVLVLSLPLIFRLLPPRSMPSNYPPYFPPVIQEAASWMKADELIMSDMPWAMAWYGQRQSLWMTLDVGAKPEDDFFHINDDHKAVKGIYLTPLTTNAKFLTEMRQSREGVWGKFYLEAVVLNNLPKGFPLRMAQPAWLPDQLFISDRIRWPQ
jgi:4-amino-4-deoxy-L-arabinose transferase-like glycosyltransferase